MDIKAQQIAVVTGGGTGIGRALVRQLAASGVHVAMCDLSQDAMDESRKLALEGAPAGTRVTTFKADVSREYELQAFRDAVIAEHNTRHIHLMFNNAGIGGGGGFVDGSRAEWERTFGVCWWGVYYGCRTFLPLLTAASEGHLVNVSSVNGFWATIGAGVSHTAYSAAKFAVKGFTESLVTDLRLNAPHVRCSVVMPGHIGTSIALNTGQVLGHGSALEMAASSVAAARKRMVRAGAPVAELPDDQIRRILHQRAVDFRDKAPTTADQAATIILDGVRANQWRILVGEDAERLDRMVRNDPESAYTPEFAEAWRDGRPPLV
ncbi:MAG: SDR family NAD(P)-dependent oxidoreductase [Burkholderiales bacterium]|jgi:NAD(P)-dependent dehydrogenase (short-subunit alcohol dehydrogenase family)|nr:SDR family NAD(P)-dependent oxidoreductase [Burkholderiales bacterium]